MTQDEDVYRALARLARQDIRTNGQPAPFAEYLTRHFLESFLHRLTRSVHAEDFVLKDGILLAVCGARRPTKDVDSQAISSSVTPAHLAQVARDIASIAAEDGVEFNTQTIDVQQIRDDAEYPGLRLRMPARLHTAKGTIVWDVSTGDPIVPTPRAVRVPRTLGDDIEILGYAPETAVAEKGVTILERGITSTRWRDYVDIVQLNRSHPLDSAQLRASAEAVAFELPPNRIHATRHCPRPLSTAEALGAHFERRMAEGNLTRYKNGFRVLVDLNEVDSLLRGIIAN